MSTETKAHVPVTGWTGPVAVRFEGPSFTQCMYERRLDGACSKIEGSDVVGGAYSIRDARGIALVTGTWDANDQAAVESLAALIAEAFNVATETGLTPRQLAERLELAIGALLTISDLPIAEQDCMLAANMREIAVRAIALTKEART